MIVAAKKWVLVGHRWAGMTVGVVAAFLAITGLTMAFRAQLEPRVDAHLLDRPACESRMALDTLVAKARELRPGKTLWRVEIPDVRTAATLVRFTDRIAVYFDPCTGEVLAQRSPWDGFFGFMEMVHKFRFITEDTEVTELIGGTVAALVVLMAFGGLFLAWPASRRALQMILRPRLKRGNRAFDLLLHRSVGVYIIAILLVSMSGALALTFQWWRSAIYTVTASPAPLPKVKAETSGPTMPLESFLKRTRELMPGVGAVTITPPRKATDGLEVIAVDRGAHFYARSYVYFDPATGDLLRFTPYADSGVGNKVVRWLSSFHTARAGILLQIVLFIGILGVPILAFTGMRSYLRNRTGEKS
jgi:vanillate O-demethylase ferredoxin subunit